MIEFVYLNWKFDEPGHLYATEILEKSRVLGLIEDLKKLRNDYNLETVHPISTIFDVYQEMKLSKIIEFLEKACTDCLVNSESDMAAYRRLLGPDLRHGPRIFEEISGITESLLTEGGKYDPVYLIRDFLRNPYNGCSEICQKAIEEAVQALAGNQRRPRDYCRTWCVGDFLEAAGIDRDNIDPDVLSIKIHVLQDDGMGYGAVNGPCTAIEDHVDDKTGEKQIRIWM
jgi:hypothetical protein